MKEAKLTRKQWERLAEIEALKQEQKDKKLGRKTEKLAITKPARERLHLTEQIFAYRRTKLAEGNKNQNKSDVIISLIMMAVTYFLLVMLALLLVFLGYSVIIGNAPFRDMAQMSQPLRIAAGVFFIVLPFALIAVYTRVYTLKIREYGLAMAEETGEEKPSTAEKLFLILAAIVTIIMFVYVLKLIFLEAIPRIV